MINILSLMGIFFWDCILIIAMVFFIEFYGKNMKRYYKQFDEYSEEEKKEAKNEIKRKLLKNLLLKIVVFVISIVCTIRYSLFLPGYFEKYKSLELLRIHLTILNQAITIGIIGLIIFGISLFKAEKKEQSEILRKIYLFNLVITVIMLFLSRDLVYFFI